MDTPPDSSAQSVLKFPAEDNELKFVEKVFISNRLNILESADSEIEPIDPPNPWRIQYLFPSKQTTQGIALADLNGDGTLDVLTDHDIGNDRYIEAWMNNCLVDRDGLKFSPAIDLPIEPSHAFAVGDMNGDGLADIIVGRQNKINQVYLSQLDSSSGGTRIRLVDEAWDYRIIDLAGTENSITESVTVVDVDQDGHLDIIFRDIDENLMLINKGIGDDYADFKLPGGGRNKKLTGTSNDILVADMNNDGLPDILLCDLGLNRNILLINKGKYDYEQVNLPGKRVSKSLAVGDVDGDGFLDVINGLQPTLMLNGGNGIDYDLVTLPILDDINKEVHGVALKDLNGDGLLDFIYCGITGPKILINRGDGYADVYQTSFFEEYGPSSMAFGDIDGDGVLDLAMTHSVYNHSHILLLSGGDAIEEIPWYDFLAPLGIDSIESLDIVLFLAVALILQLTWMCCCRSRRKDRKKDGSSDGVLKKIGKKMKEKVKSEATESEMVSLQSSMESDIGPDDD